MLVGTLLIVCFTISVFAAMFSNTRASEPIACTVYVDPAVTTARICEYFNINVSIKDHYSPPSPLIYDYEFTLSYNSSQMTPINAWDGGFLLPPLQYFIWNVVDDPGDIDRVWCYALTADGGAQGAGTLATIQFHCDNAGTARLDFPKYQVFLSDEIGRYFEPTTLIGGIVYQKPAHTWIDPPTYTVPICVQFPVNVMVKDVNDLYSFSLDLSYNTLYVDCIDIVDGGFLPPPTQVTRKVIDDTLGIIEFDLTSQAGSGASGSGSITKITFHCTGAGESLLNLDTVLLYNSAGFPIPTTTAGSRVIQEAYWEPVKLMDIVAWPYPYALVDLPFFPPGTPDGYQEIKLMLEDKGFVFDPAVGGTAVEVSLFGTMSGHATSWWSSNTLSDGTQACLLSVEWDDHTLGSMAMGFVTNLLAQPPGVDPYIIVNAMPYMYLRFYWWAWPTDIILGHVVTWPYWWYDSHSHPNWFWGPYWWWRTYTRAYYYPYTYVPYWRPWWGWWWHWIYWRHWYWWSTYFPYDP